MAIRSYTDSTLKIPAQGASTLTIKRQGCPPSTYTLENADFFSISTDNWQPGTYYAQLTRSDGAVVGTEQITMVQNLATAPADFDPRSQAEQTLDAIDAMLAGRATAQQRKVQLGDKSIEYSTLAELMEWRAHFQKEVRKERGEAAFITRQLFEMDEVY